MPFIPKLTAARLIIGGTALIGIVALTLAFLYYRHYRGNEGTFNGQGTRHNVLFVNPFCGTPCSNAEKLLKAENVPYEKILAAGPFAYHSFRTHGGYKTFPMFVAGDNRAIGFNEDRFREVFAELYGLEKIDPLKREIYRSHFDENGAPKVVMYGAEWCPYCKKAQRFFERENIPFTEWDVEKEPVGAEYFDALLAQGYPLIYVGYRRFQYLNEPLIKKAIDSHRINPL